MTTDETARNTRRGAFFGRRKGHKLRPGQTRLMTEVLPALALDLAKPAADLRALFPVPVDLVRLEIGFGGGEHLLHEARQNPAIGFIGCEPYQNGMARALAVIEAEGLKNIRLHYGDALGLIEWLPEASLARIDILYPDPWPKRRHWKRRFISEQRVGAARENSRARRRAPLRHRHRELRGMGALALAPRAGSHLDRRAGRRLAVAVGGFSEHALRGQGDGRRQTADLFALSAPLKGLRRAQPALYSQNKNVHLNAILGSNVESGPRPGPALFC